MTLRLRIERLERAQGGRGTLVVPVKYGQPDEEIERIIDEACRANNATREDYDNIIQVVKFSDDDLPE